MYTAGRRRRKTRDFMTEGRSPVESDFASGSAADNVEPWEESEPGLSHN